MLVREYYTFPTAATARTEQQPLTSLRKSKSKNKNKRRFSETQIRSMESMFETESRPEPQLKQRLANQLGLQPRQVAIWFQNRRARSKSKQIERDYSILKTSYETLASKFESLKKENQSLLIQLQRLKNLTGEGSNEETEEEPEFQMKTSNDELGLPSCNGNSKNVDYFGDETGILNMTQLANGSLTSTENWCSFESTTLLDNWCCSSQWC